MGFSARRIYNLEFEDPEFEDLEVKVRSVPLGRFLDVMELVDKPRPTQDDIGRMCDLLAEHLLSWNVTDTDDDGDEVPLEPDRDGLLACDPRLVMEIIDAWSTRVTGVPRPLEQPSNGGGPSLVASIPMEPLSPNPGS